MAAKTQLTKLLRSIHLYIGAFITPAILFFAFTGAIQTFGLHETNRDHPDYKPAHWVAVLGQLHKKQDTAVPVRRSPPAARPRGGPAVSPIALQSSPGSPAPAPKRHPLPLRIFFVLVCFGLFASTLTGLALTYRYVRNNVLVTALVVAGVVVPVLLIFV